MVAPALRVGYALFFDDTLDATLSCSRLPLVGFLLLPGILNHAKALTERGFVFVSTNYRLLPDVSMDELIRDVAQSLGWVHKNIAKYGGDPQRIFVGGHSAGAQLAALICIDERYVEEAGASLEILKGCIPVDGDTYDIPKIIMTAELRQTLYGGKMFTFGHRQEFGNDPEKHVDFSAVTHVEKGKSIPPFLIFYFSGNPDTRAQAGRLEEVSLPSWQS